MLWSRYDDFRLGILIGMTYGDGNLIKRSAGMRTGRWRVEFCEGDLSLVRKYATLTRRLFNLQPRIRNRETWFEMYYSSRIAYEFLTFVGEHPNGKKAGHLRIPEVARLYPETLRGFLCGLFSVEGYVKGGRYLRLTVEMLERRLLWSVADELRKLGFQPHSYAYMKDGKRMFGVYLYGFEDCGRFLDKVGLLGKRRIKLSRFLTTTLQPRLARKQPGGGLVRRM